MTAVLALPTTYAPRVAAAVAAAPRLPIIWLRGQACGGDTEAFLRAANPTTAELLLQFLSVDYLEALMSPSGAAAEQVRDATAKAHRDGYVLVIEGAIPTADGGAACTIGGRPLVDVARELSAGAVATIAVGSCAVDGGLGAASGGSTGASGVGHAISPPRLISLPGCPVNPANLAATIVHYLTFKELPATDPAGRPLFAYGALVHNECERRAHFEFGEFVQAWGDEGAQKGWCLYKLGCKGPETFANCASVGFDGGISWPVKAGVGCIGCTMPAFWDTMSPFSRRLPSPLPFVPGLTVDQVGVAAVAGITGVAG
ncbi:MAG TPA: hydrogenase small subunit, partial [Candidatus Acidoferrales bacterium]|nr:hydrogenase small subunit [Candidatus Acidoferrales bacterium]